MSRHQLHGSRIHKWPMGSIPLSMPPADLLKRRLQQGAICACPCSEQSVAGRNARPRQCTSSRHLRGQGDQPRRRRSKVPAARAACPPACAQPAGSPGPCHSARPADRVGAWVSCTIHYTIKSCTSGFIPLGARQGGRRADYGARRWFRCDA
eukprot:8824982-Pyramimonas_sp.AAC.2